MADDELVALAAAVGAALRARNWNLALAESCTGGSVAATITAVPGSSGWFDCGFVTYSNASKVNMLGVSPETLAKHGAISQAVTIEMARGAIHRSRAQAAIAISGIAGPEGGTADKPVGTVWFSWATPLGLRSEKMQFHGDRASVRRAATRHALLHLVPST